MTHTSSTLTPMARPGVDRHHSTQPEPGAVPDGIRPSRCGRSGADVRTCRESRVRCRADERAGVRMYSCRLALYHVR